MYTTQDITENCNARAIYLSNLVLNGEVTLTHAREFAFPLALVFVEIPTTAAVKKGLARSTGHVEEPAIEKPFAESSFRSGLACSVEVRGPVFVLRGFILYRVYEKWRR